MFQLHVTPSSARVGESQGGTFLLSHPGDVGSDLAFAFGLGIIEGENKAPLYFDSPLLSVKAVP